MDLRYAKVLAPPGTGTTTMNMIMSRLQNHTIPHDHTLRIDPKYPGSYIITIRDTVERMMSGWKFRLYKTRSHRTWVDSSDLNDFVEAFCNKSHPLHLQSQRVYWNSVRNPLPAVPGRVVPFGDPFLISQTDYLRGYDHRIHAIVFVCTEELDIFAKSVNQTILNINSHHRYIKPLSYKNKKSIREMYKDDDSLFQKQCRVNKNLR
jgi:hypothetical protein